MDKSAAYKEHIYKQASKKKERNHPLPGSGTNAAKAMGLGVAGIVGGKATQVGAVNLLKGNIDRRRTDFGDVTSSARETARHHHLDVDSIHIPHPIGSAALDPELLRKQNKRVQKSPMIPERDKRNFQEMVDKVKKPVVLIGNNEETALHEIGHVKQFNNPIWKHIPITTKRNMLFAAPLMSSKVREKIRSTKHGHKAANKAMDFVEDNPGTTAFTLGYGPRIVRELDASRFATMEMIRKHGIRKGLGSAKTLGPAAVTYVAGSMAVPAAASAAFRIANYGKTHRDKDKNRR